MIPMTTVGSPYCPLHGGKVFGKVLARRLMQFVVPKVVSESQCGY